MQVDFPFKIGQQVIVDGDRGFIVMVSKLLVNATGGIEIECSWMHDAQNRTDWFPPWRLADAAR